MGKADERRLDVLAQLIGSGGRGRTQAELLGLRRDASLWDDSPRRVLQEDLSQLKARGLIRRCRQDERVIYLGPENRKPVDCVLTRDEHDAVFRSRQRLNRFAVPSPTGADRPLDRVFVLVRLLEESGGILDRVEAQSWMGWSWRQFQVAASTIQKVFDAHDPGSLQIELQSHDGEHPTGLSLRRKNESDLRGTGSETLGLFPYSLAEVEERLALIDDAWAGASVADRELLGSASEKLRRWKARLQHSNP